MMRQAVRLGDRGLADEVARHAADHGWADVLEAWGRDGGLVAVASFLRNIRGAIPDPGRHMFRWRS